MTFRQTRLQALYTDVQRLKVDFHFNRCPGVRIVTLWIKAKCCFHFKKIFSLSIPPWREVVLNSIMFCHQQNMISNLYKDIQIWYGFPHTAVTRSGGSKDESLLLRIQYTHLLLIYYHFNLSNHLLFTLSRFILIFYIVSNNISITWFYNLFKTMEF